MARPRKEEGRIKRVGGSLSVYDNEGDYLGAISMRELCLLVRRFRRYGKGGVLAKLETAFPLSTNGGTGKEKGSSLKALDSPREHETV